MKKATSKRTTRAGARPMTTKEWAEIRFPAMQFAVPSKPEFMAHADEQAAALPFLRAVLACNDQELEANVRSLPNEHFELIEWLASTADSYEKNALTLKRAAFRLLAVLARMELAAQSRC